MSKEKIDFLGEINRLQEENKKLHLENIKLKKENIASLLKNATFKVNDEVEIHFKGTLKNIVIDSCGNVESTIKYNGYEVSINTNSMKELLEITGKNL